MLVGSLKPIPAGPAACVSKRILIADYLPQMRGLIRAYLDSDPELLVCGEAIDGFDAIDKARNLKPDLIILEASMPRMSGIEAARKLKKILPQTAIILFTSHESLMRGFDAHEVGVDAVVPKDRGMSLLKESVKALLKRQSSNASKK
jgi:NarL family two-component system response regulator LiaR